MSNRMMWRIVVTLAAVGAFFLIAGFVGLWRNGGLHG
jgi:hypothetical protein